MATISVGHGYDIHPLGGGIPFMLGGVLIPYPQGAKGHSDGDVLLHATIDALLGAAGLGDIGGHFPPSDQRWAGTASVELLRETMRMLRDAGFSVSNVDATVILERPMLAPHIPLMRERMATALHVKAEQVNVKAKTNEGLDAVGRRQAVAAHAVVLLDHA